MVGALSSVPVASAMHHFIADLQNHQSYAGVSALLLLALHSRLRVFVWYGRRREDVVQRYAPWASASITKEATFEAVGCVLRRDENTAAVSTHIIDDPRDLNHWVACMKIGASHGGGAAPGFSDGQEDESTMTLEAIYLSLGRVLLQTVSDGDCLFDVMCLMLGTRRQREVRSTS